MFKFNSINNNNIVINGKSFNVKGNNVSIINNKVYVDGKQVDTGELSGEVVIKFEGDLANLQSDGGVTVNGNVHGDVDAKGSVNCGNVEGDVDAGGSINCGNVKGDADAGGSIMMNKGF